MATGAKLAVAFLAAAMSAGCATPSPMEAKSKPAKSPAVADTSVVPAAPARVRTKQPEAAAIAPVNVANSEPAAAAPINAAQPDPMPSPAQQLAVLRVEAGALVTRVNGDPKLACTQPDCHIPLPPGTHQFTVGYKDTETRAGSRVTFASMNSRVIEITLEPGHTYSLTASGRYTPKWWIAVEDQTANRIVYNDREKPE